MKLEYTRNANYWDKASKGNVDNLTVVPIRKTPPAWRPCWVATWT